MHLVKMLASPIALVAKYIFKPLYPRPQYTNTWIEKGSWRIVPLFIYTYYLKMIRNEWGLSFNRFIFKFYRGFDCTVISICHKIKN